MTLAPLLDASPVIQIHAFAALAAFGLGLVQFAAPKRTLPHKTVGWMWVALLAIIAISSFWIHEIRMFGSRSARSICCRSLSSSCCRELAGGAPAYVSAHSKGMRGIFF